MSVSPGRFDLREIVPQPWKNGAGLTREIASGGAGAAAFDWRISVAEVDRDAPFSAFPGIDRCIVLLHGAGMRLRSHDGAIDHALTDAHTPFRFTGDTPLSATLVDGPSSDLNVMTRRGVFHSEVSCERSAASLNGGDVTLVLCSIGTWRIGRIGRDDATTLEPLQGLLWRAPIPSLAIEPIGESAALLLVRLCRDPRP